MDHPETNFSHHGSDVSAVESWASITPTDLINAIYRRLPSVMITAFVVTVIAAFMLMTWPSRYSSDGLMYVRLGRAALSVDPTSQSSNSVSLQESRTSGVITIGDMLSSREIAERAAEKVGFDRINEPRTWVDRAGLLVGSLIPKGSPSTEMSNEDYKRQIAKENAIANVHDWVSVYVPKDGYTVSVSGLAPDPVLVREVVQAVMDEYKNYHVEAHSADGSLEFFEQKTLTSREAAIEANRLLQTTKNEMGWMSAEAAEATLRQRIVQLEIAHDEVASALAEAASNDEELERRLSTIKQWVPTEITKGIAKQSGEDMRSQLYELQVQQSEDLANFKPAHPRYKMLREKVTQSKLILDAEGKDHEETMEALNPVRVTIEGEHQLAAAKVAGLRSKQTALAKTLSKARKDLQRLNHDAITLSKLKMECDIAEKNYLGHAASLEEARVASELDSQKLSDVAIIQDASLNLKKSGPSKLLLLLAGMFVGVLLGVLQAILRDKPEDQRERQISTPRERATKKTDSYQGHKEILGGVGSSV